MVNAAHRKVETALAKRTEPAMLREASAACGSSVIYDGNRTRENINYRKGPGVCAHS